MDCAIGVCSSPILGECDVLGQCSVVFQLQNLKGNTFPLGVPLMDPTAAIFMKLGWVVQKAPHWFMITDIGLAALAEFMSKG